MRAPAPVVLSSLPSGPSGPSARSLAPVSPAGCGLDAVCNERGLGSGVGRRSSRWAQRLCCLAACLLTAASAVMMKRGGAPAPLARVAPVDAASAVPGAHIASEGGLCTPAAAAAPPAVAAVATRFFDGRAVVPVKAVMLQVTAYSPDARSCGTWADGRTATNTSVWTNAMRIIAADTSVFPMGTLLSVPGYHGGEIVPVLDRGGAIKGARLDALYPTHERALRWGVQDVAVTVWEYADGLGDGESETP